MKIVYQNVICLVLFAAYNYQSLAEEEQINLDVAAFFEGDTSQQQVAFGTAIDNFNRMDNLMRFNPKTYSMPEVDSFEMSNFLCNLTENGNIGGVICPTSGRLTPIIESICVNLEIPNIQLYWRYSPQNVDSVSVNFYPYEKLLFQGIGTIVKNLQWRSTVLFYENTENFLKLQDVLKVQNYDPTLKANTINVIELGPGPDYRAAFKQIVSKSEHRIIIDCKTENIIPILRQAQELKLMEKQFSYFLTSLDAHTVNLEGLNILANITTIRIINPESSYFKNALSRWQVYAEQHSIKDVFLEPYSIKTETAIMYDAVTTYLKAVRDLGITVKMEPSRLSCKEEIKSWESGLLISSFIKAKVYDKENLQSITGALRFDPFGRRTNFTIYIVHGFKEDVVATWNPESTNSNRLKFLKSEEDRNKELEKKWSSGVVTVASILGKPYLMERPKPVDGEALKGNSRYEGFSMDLIKELAEVLHIDFQFEVLKSGQRGAYDKKTKSWNGLIKEILDGRAELGICDFTITPERREVVDFSTPFMRLGISILYQKPKAKVTSMYAFIDPLSNALWIYTGTIYLAISVVLFFIARASPMDWENPHPCDPEPEELENIWNIKNCLWLTLGSIMNQGCDIMPKGAAPRLVASMWWFYTIIVTNSYMANLAAFLTNQRSQNDIKSAEDLALQSKVKYGTMADGSTEAFFRDSNYSLYQRMYTSMQQFKPSVFEKSNDEGVARVQNSKTRGYAFLMESATLEYQLSTKCDLMQVGNWLDSKSYGIAMPLDYPHRSRINEALLDLQEKGVIKGLKERWWDSSHCPRAVEEETSKLALQNVGGVFVVLIVGLALAYVVAIGEFLWNVRNVSVEEHISFFQALKVELKFALNVTVTKKRVKPQVSEGSSASSRHSKSLARSMLRGAGSFLRLDNSEARETISSGSLH